MQISFPPLARIPSQNVFYSVDEGPKRGVAEPSCLQEICCVGKICYPRNAGTRENIAKLLQSRDFSLALMWKCHQIKHFLEGGRGEGSCALEVCGARHFCVPRPVAHPSAVKKAASPVPSHPAERSRNFWSWRNASGLSLCWQSPAPAETRQWAKTNEAVLAAAKREKSLAPTSPPWPSLRK